MTWIGCDRCGKKIRETDDDFVQMFVEGKAANDLFLGLKDYSRNSRSVELCVPCAMVLKSWLEENLHARAAEARAVLAKMDEK